MSEGVDLGYMGSHVAEKIREMIFSGELLPKARIGQQSTARLLGISRIPVREALRQLESEGLVVILPNSGARVASLDLDECIDTYKLRERLEPLALGESIPHLTPVQIEDIVNRAESLRARGEDALAWLHQDLEFHLATYAGVPSQRLMSMIEGLWNTTHRYRRVLFTTFAPHDFEIANYEHALICDAIVSGHVSRAERQLIAHLERSRIRLSENPGLFF